MEHLNEVRTHIYGINPIKRVLTISADMSKHEDIESVIAMTLTEFDGQLGVLVKKALTIGRSPMPYLLDYPLEDFDYVIDTNLVGPFLMIKKALPAMIEHSGSIIEVTSDLGEIGVMLESIRYIQSWY